MRLIDADTVLKLFDAEFKETIKLIREGETHLDNLAEGFCEAYRVIQNMPTVDAVPVVRCRECTYAKNAKVNKKGFRICPASHMEIVDDDYCSYGELEENNEVD